MWSFLENLRKANDMGSYNIVSLSQKEKGFFLYAKGKRMNAVMKRVPMGTPLSRYAGSPLKRGEQKKRNGQVIGNNREYL